MYLFMFLFIYLCIYLFIYFTHDVGVYVSVLTVPFCFSGSTTRRSRLWSLKDLFNRVSHVICYTLSTTYIVMVGRTEDVLYDSLQLYMVP